MRRSRWPQPNSLFAKFQSGLRKSVRHAVFFAPFTYMSKHGRTEYWSIGQLSSGPGEYAVRFQLRQPRSTWAPLGKVQPPGSRQKTIRWARIPQGFAPGANRRVVGATELCRLLVAAAPPWTIGHRKYSSANDIEGFGEVRKEFRLRLVKIQARPGGPARRKFELSSFSTRIGKATNLRPAKSSWWGLVLVFDWDWFAASTPLCRLIGSTGNLCDFIFLSTYYREYRKKKFMIVYIHASGAFYCRMW